MPRIANFVMGLAGGIAGVGSSKKAIIIDNNEIHIRYEKPNKTERAWDFNTFKNANIFLRGYANAIDITVKDLGVNDNNELLEAKNSDYNMIPSQKYKFYMELKAIKDAFSREGPKLQLMFYLLIAIAIGEFVLLMAVFMT